MPRDPGICGQQPVQGVTYRGLSVLALEINSQFSGDQPEPRVVQQ